MPTTADAILWILKIRYLPEALRAVFKGPYTVKFPFGDTVDTGKYRGRTVWDQDVCIGCGACYEVCPADAIEMVDDTESDPPMRRFVLHYDRCIFCGHCHYNCTKDDGIYQTTEWDLATFDRTQATTHNEKELLACELCGEVISTKDHLKWAARKVGPKLYANPTLAMTLEGQVVAAPAESAPKGRRPAERRDIMRVLCPHCRRVVVFEETT